MRTLAHERDRIDLLRRLRRVRPESGRAWGRMSAHQMVCHLADALRMVTGEKPATCAHGPLVRGLLRGVALYAPIPWPPGIPTWSGIDQAREGSPPTEFARDLAQVESLVAAITAPTSRLDQYVHPLFGPMSHDAWLRWGYLHLDHHLRQFRA